MVITTEFLWVCLKENIDNEIPITIINKDSREYDGITIQDATKVFDCGLLNNIADVEESITFKIDQEYVEDKDLDIEHFYYSVPKKYDLNEIIANETKKELEELLDDENKLNGGHVYTLQDLYYATRVKYDSLIDFSVINILDLSIDQVRNITNFLTEVKILRDNLDSLSDNILNLLEDFASYFDKAEKHYRYLTFCNLYHLCLDLEDWTNYSVNKIKEKGGEIFKSK